MLIAVGTAPELSFPAANAGEDPDHALARRACAGEVAAFEHLYRRHAGRVHGVIARLVGGRSGHTEELAQDAFVRAWQALPRYRFESAFSTWLHRVAVNTALMSLRARRARPQEDEDELAMERASTPDSAGHATALAMDLERAVATLPPRARAVLVLHDVEGWTHEDIAAELGMAVGSSKAQLHRARGLLRAKLGA
jgi:RNA polymerase sigma-70 factor (ECF subfamily)